MEENINKAVELAKEIKQASFPSDRDFRWQHSLPHEEVPAQKKQSNGIIKERDFNGEPSSPTAIRNETCFFGGRRSGGRR